jgi:uncharacterized protein (DUF2235 family)
MYTNPDETAGALYQRIFGLSRPVQIEFLGAWDTVSSLGGIGLPLLPFAHGVQSVRFFRQALALDERRIRFTPEYRQYEAIEKAMGRAIQVVKDELDEAQHQGDQKAIYELENKLEHLHIYPRDAWTLNNREIKRQHVDCWFMGAHSDVGGGTDLNNDPSLSNIPFR